MSESKEAREFVSGMAHELKNPLATLQMGVDYFQHRLAGAQTPEDQRILESMVKSIRRASLLMTGAADLAKNRGGDFQAGDLDALIRASESK
ncbi:MAG: histidine kinase dimerization/phospho-acceptor domain-containing protein [Verrucomicrobiota bacterium]